MVTISVSIPQELRVRMNKLDEVNWSAIARKAFEKKVEEIEFLKKLAKKSKLTAKDAKLLSNKISSSASQKFIDEDCY